MNSDDIVRPVMSKQSAFVLLWLSFGWLNCRTVIPDPHSSLCQHEETSFGLSYLCNSYTAGIQACENLAIRPVDSKLERRYTCCVSEWSRPIILIVEANNQLLEAFERQQEQPNYQESVSI